jgi:hypothetical protein
MWNPFNDPARWAQLAVGTRHRFVVMNVSHAIVLFAVIYDATPVGWRSALVPALVLLWFQFAYLIALRRLLGELHKPTSNADHAQHGI